MTIFYHFLTDCCITSCLKTILSIRLVEFWRTDYIISGKVSCDHVHIFISYRPQVALSKLVQYLKGSSSRILLQEFAHLRKQFWGNHFWARGYMAVSSGNITDEMIQQYIDEQEGEPVNDDRFLIDSTL
uniref:IS200/IS605 family transposase n=1 Tax=Rickettsia endosymbiont of Urophora cardui TaxID=3066265 RepID=UPI00313D1A56